MSLPSAGSSGVHLPWIIAPHSQTTPNGAVLPAASTDILSTYSMLGEACEALLSPLLSPWPLWFFSRCSLRLTLATQRLKQSRMEHLAAI